MEPNRKEGELVTNKERLWRWSIYLSGTVVGCLGMIMCTRTNLGVTAVTSLSFSLSNGLQIEFSTMLLISYLVMVGLQFLLKGKQKEWSDLLQIPFTVLFSWLVDRIEVLIAFITPETFLENLLVFLLGATLLGGGVSMSVPMRIIPNPGDGLVRAISIAIQKDQGTAKNLLDIICVILAVGCDLLLQGKVSSVGLGSLISMIYVGRVISLSHRFFLKKALRAAGLENR